MSWNDCDYVGKTVIIMVSVFVVLVMAGLFGWF